jgi:Mrp family chromosome partitioning ATPase
MRALVVELNAVRPVFARWFGLESERGLEALLRGEKTVPECIQRGGDGLALLPAGVENRAPGADRGLPSAIERILAETKSDFDLVLFDAPPILEQPVVLAAGAVVPRLLLVVEAGRTPHELLTRVKQQAEAEGIEIVGAILNKQRWYIPKWLYLWVTR